MSRWPEYRHEAWRRGLEFDSNRLTSPENKCCYTRNIDKQANAFAINVPERGETVKLHDKIPRFGS